MGTLYTSRMQVAVFVLLLVASASAINSRVNYGGRARRSLADLQARVLALETNGACAPEVRIHVDVEGGYLEEQQGGHEDHGQDVDHSHEQHGHTHNTHGSHGEHHDASHEAGTGSESDEHADHHAHDAGHVAHQGHDIVGYALVAEGGLCSDNTRIGDADECRVAAAQLNYGNDVEEEQASDFPAGCYLGPS